jgi:hypothetical protein
MHRVYPSGVLFQIVKGMQRLRLVTASPINETEPIT